jgi:hypothetical protein
MFIFQSQSEYLLVYWAIMLNSFALFQGFQTFINSILCDAVHCAIAQIHIDSALYSHKPYWRLMQAAFFVQIAHATLNRCCWWQSLHRDGSWFWSWQQTVMGSKEWYTSPECMLVWRRNMGDAGVDEMNDIGIWRLKSVFHQLPTCFFDLFVSVAHTGSCSNGSVCNWLNMWDHVHVLAPSTMSSCATVSCHLFCLREDCLGDVWVKKGRNRRE